jgi:hypothetical protein
LESLVNALKALKFISVGSSAAINLPPGTIPTGIQAVNKFPCAVRTLLIHQRLMSFGFGLSFTGAQRLHGITLGLGYGGMVLGKIAMQKGNGILRETAQKIFDMRGIVRLLTNLHGFESLSQQKLLPLGQST